MRSVLLAGRIFFSHIERTANLFIYFNYKYKSAKLIEFAARFLSKVYLDKN